jgi:hypothetical protein
MISRHIIIVINIFHALFLAFMLLAPFHKSNHVVLMHCLIVPFLFMHWLTNNNTCMLTMIETQLRKTNDMPHDENNSYMGRLINPVFDMNKSVGNGIPFLYGMTLLVWVLSLTTLYSRYSIGEIVQWQDLFR